MKGGAEPAYQIDRKGHLVSPSAELRLYHLVRTEVGPETRAQEKTGCCNGKHALGHGIEHVGVECTHTCSHVHEHM